MENKKGGVGDGIGKTIQHGFAFISMQKNRCCRGGTEVDFESLCRTNVDINIFSAC